MKTIKFTLILALTALFSCPIAVNAGDRSIKPISIIEALAENDEENPGLTLEALSEAASDARKISEKTKFYACRIPGCIVRTARLVDMCDHYQEHGGGFACPAPGCEHINNTHSALVAHLESRHPGVKCYTAGDYFNAKKPLPVQPAIAPVAIPYLTLAPTAQAKTVFSTYSCQVPGCTKTTSNVEEMRFHGKDEHGLLFKCSECEFTSKYHTIIRGHAFNKHGVKYPTEGEIFQGNFKHLILVPQDAQPQASQPKRTIEQPTDSTAQEKRVRLTQPPAQPILPQTMAQLVARTTGYSWDQPQPGAHAVSSAPPAQAPVQPNIQLALALQTLQAQQQFAAQREKHAQELRQYELFLRHQALAQEQERQRQEAAFRHQQLAQEHALFQQETLRLMMIAAGTTQQQAQSAQPAYATTTTTASQQPTQTFIAVAPHVAVKKPKTDSVRIDNKSIFRCDVCAAKGISRNLENASNTKRHQRDAHKDILEYDISAFINGQWVKQTFKHSVKPKNP